ncbi:uncharacterized protein LOC110449599 [Mizuhopecten yessoensis]|uniref:Short-chain collagen C4 n=1 Tax=Mizuhopecten yessoensis TaxID=6573 RepID=A0A210QQV2_MIZYE|nr:uncharacterized protein LOC110449599 [Mizuhopecten yessoensis]OWF51111.1 hypothetical protein KP79_PYT25631 [Mizuhopecten yessoensis]
MVTVSVLVRLMVIISYVLLYYVSCAEDPNKRILLSDPNYFNDQMTHLQAELQTLQATVQTQNVILQTQNGKISSLEQQLSNANQGYTGGSWYDHSGGAADTVCLPRDPVWGPYKDLPSIDYSSRIYGAEYSSPNSATPFGQHSNDEEVPCAVCRSTSFVSSVMIPARTTCYSGWTKAYSGSLAAGYYVHKAATQYVCVDENAQPLDGGANTNDDGVMLFAVRAQCGSLRCPPYEQNKYLSCVVCMK